MKKAIFSAAMFSIFATAANAQTFSIGAKVGSTWNTVSAPSFSGTIDFKTMTNINFGLVGEVGLTENFSIQPEINYVQKGFRLNEGTDLTLFGVNLPVGASAVTAIKYVDVPILGKYKFNTEGAGFYVFAGPSVGYATGGNLETHAKVIIDFNIASTPIDLDAVNYKRWEVGAVVGGGVELPIGRAQLFADVRYSHGFNQVYEVPIVGAKVTNQAFGLNVGFKVPFN